jgi:uncharacterized protein YecE (DUF72 family)
LYETHHSTVKKWFCGTSGLVLPVKNKLEYPEHLREKSRLHYYSTLFNTIEINSSFYRLPQRKTVERWATEVTDNFRFTFKLSKEITHAKSLSFERKALQNFFDVVRLPKKKRGCLLIQFPGKTTSECTGQLKKLLKVVASFSDWKLAIEFRHESWYAPETAKLLRQYNAAGVIHDLRTFSLEPIENDSGRIVYIRFHGTEKNYRGSYSDETLMMYATRIRQWLNEGKEVYAYFNNTLGPAVHNLMTLDSFVRKSLLIHGQ